MIMYYVMTQDCILYILDYYIGNELLGFPSNVGQLAIYIQHHNEKIMQQYKYNNGE